MASDDSAQYESQYQASDASALCAHHGGEWFAASPVSHHAVMVSVFVCALGTPLGPGGEGPEEGYLVLPMACGEVREGR